MQNQEKIVQTKQCKHCNKSFDITDKDLEFYDKISPKINGNKYQIPTPTLCPDCRQRRRLSFRNERKLYRHKCDATGKDIISIYSPDKTYKVYDQKVRRSDDRNPMDYGKDFDFSKSFTEQFDELMREIPHMSISSDNCEGCDYSNFVLDSKNCYLLFGGGKNENIYYSDFVNNSNSCLDCSISSGLEYCYECINCQDCFKCNTCINCNNSNNLIGCSDCENCSFCYNSNELMNCSYYFENKQLTKEEYIDKINKLLQKDKKYKNTKNIYIIGAENCTGKNIINSKNCANCNNINNSENLKYSGFTPNANHSYDLDFMAPFGSEFGYELCTSTGTKYSISTYLTRLCTISYYCYECRNCENIFGCIGLRNKQYCIFNKQYTEAEYSDLVPKIIAHMQSTGEWGEFFHPSLSPFGYNETVANEYFHCISEDNKIIQKIDRFNKSIESSEKSSNLPTNLHIFGYKRSDYESPVPQVAKSIRGQDLPDSIDAVSDDILQTAVICEVTGKPFRIIPQELAFYRKHNIPLPRRHPDQRHLDRMKLRPGRILYLRNCDCCGEEMLSVYPSEDNKIVQKINKDDISTKSSDKSQNLLIKVYCEKCYQKEVYG